MTTNENLVLNLPYNEIYDRIVMLKKGAYQLDSNNEDDVENCKWLAAIFDVFIDLPLYVATHILVKSNIKFDYDLFLAENHNPIKVRNEGYDNAAYQLCYHAILDVAFETEEYLSDEEFTNEQIEKALWITAIYKLLSDIQNDVVYPLFRKIDFHFNWETFAEERGLL